MADKIWDVIIIGGGIAGCFAAVKAKETGAKDVLLIDKGYVGKSGCATFGAGSFKGYIPDADDYDLWYSKAVEEGCYMNDQEWLQAHLAEVFERVKDLENWGVRFMKEEDGSYRRIEGQGSSDKRPIPTLMFYGPELMDKARKAVLKAGVVIQDKTMVCKLLHSKDDPKAISGALGFHLETGEFTAYTGRSVVASAGAQCYKSNYGFHKMVTGDTHVMALEAGAELSNMEFACHHLSYAGFDTTGMNIIQGCRGGFVNKDGDAFTEWYDPEYKDRGCLNRLSTAFGLEADQGRAPIYLDVSYYKEREMNLFHDGLPILYKAFERAGIIKDNEFVQKRLEWTSAFSGTLGFGGGIRIRLDGGTNLKGLYAAGDASNGPASGVEGFTAYGIPHATTNGARAGIGAAEYARTVGEVRVDQAEIDALIEEIRKPLSVKEGVEPDHIVTAVQEAIIPKDVYLLRTEENLQKALDQILYIKKYEMPYIKAYDSHYLRMAIEAKNMVLCAELFLRAALMRKETRGSHLRMDYPETDNKEWLKWILISQENGELKFRLEDVPIDKYPMKPKEERYRHPAIINMEKNRR